MSDRILDFSEEAAHLSVRHSNLLIRRNEKPDVTLPLVEIGVVITSHPAISCSAALLAGISAAGGAIVVCDDKRLPVGMMLPLQGNSVQTERMAHQITAKEPVRKRLWQQIVRSKIHSQAAALQLESGRDLGLALMARRVRSGDPQNIEAQAARRYWSALFDGCDFRRDPSLDGINAVLNYGYTVLRAMTARSICGAGLHPSIGLHHHNRYSQFVLADDLMEPFRPVVDRAARAVVATWGADTEVTKEVKAMLFEALNGRYRIDGDERGLFDIISRLTSSLAAAFANKSGKLVLPTFPEFFLDGTPQS